VKIEEVREGVVCSTIRQSVNKETRLVLGRKFNNKLKKGKKKRGREVNTL